mgnify:CR=1 FL=1
MTLPCLTSDIPGIGGAIKQRLEDFVVEEIPLYPLSGRGDHVFFRVTKSGLPTSAAADRIARHMGVSVKNIGVAGLKDARAVTSQWMSIERADVEQLKRFDDSKVKISDITLHNNKLRLGHLAGNAFSIRIRGVGEAQLPAAQQVMDVLARRGVPNFFGPQRFGLRKDTGTLGRAMVRNDAAQFAALFLGGPQEADPPDIRAAREAFDRGDYDAAYEAWPRNYFDQRKALNSYRKSQDPRAVLAAVDWRLKRLFVSAFQSEIFNIVLQRRLNEIDTIENGDLAQKTDSGGVFLVEDAGHETPRCERFEISATGPIYGYRCRLAQGRPGQIEQDVLASQEMLGVEIRRVGKLEVRGARRSLRFAMTNPAVAAGADDHGPYLQVTFAAPSGCYATIVLGEIMKNELPEAAEPDDHSTGE